MNCNEYKMSLCFLLSDNRGFMTANGQPDQSRSARYVLKDYVNGRLLYCHAPPEYEQEEFHHFAARVRPELVEENLPKQQQRAMRVSNFRATSLMTIFLIENNT